MPRSSHSKTAQAPKVAEYLVRTADHTDYARDPDLEACKTAARGLGAGTYIVALDAQLIPFGEPVYTVTDEPTPAPKPVEIDVLPADEDGLEAEQVDEYGEEDVPGSELSPQAQAVKDNAAKIAAGEKVTESPVKTAAKKARKPRAPKATTNDPYDNNDGQAELVIKPGCGCGCGEPANSGRTFLQGHDQALIGRLARLKAAGGQVRWNTSDAGEFVDEPLAYGARVFSEGGMAKLERALANGTAAPKKAAPAIATKEKVTASVPEVCEHGLDPARCDGHGNYHAKANHVHTATLGLGAKVRIKVGRHEYDGTIHGMNQAGKVTAVQYSTRTGDTKVAHDKFTIVS